MTVKVHGINCYFRQQQGENREFVLNEQKEDTLLLIYIAQILVERDVNTLVEILPSSGIQNIVEIFIATKDPLMSITTHRFFELISREGTDGRIKNALLQYIKSDENLERFFNAMLCFDDKFTEYDSSNIILNLITDLMPIISNDLSFLSLQMLLKTIKKIEKIIPERLGVKLSSGVNKALTVTKVDATLFVTAVKFVLKYGTLDEHIDSMEIVIQHLELFETKETRIEFSKSILRIRHQIKKDKFIDFWNCAFIYLRTVAKKDPKEFGDLVLSMDRLMFFMEFPTHINNPSIDFMRIIPNCFNFLNQLLRIGKLKFKSEVIYLLESTAQTISTFNALCTENNSMNPIIKVLCLMSTHHFKNEWMRIVSKMDTVFERFTKQPTFGEEEEINLRKLLDCVTDTFSVQKKFLFPKVANFLENRPVPVSINDEQDSPRSEKQAEHLNPKSNETTTPTTRTKLISKADTLTKRDSSNGKSSAHTMHKIIQLIEIGGSAGETQNDIILQSVFGNPQDQKKSSNQFTKVASIDRENPRINRFDNGYNDMFEIMNGLENRRDLIRKPNHSNISGTKQQIHLPQITPIKPIQKGRNFVIGNSKRGSLVRAAPSISNTNPSRKKRDVKGRIFEAKMRTSAPGFYSTMTSITDKSNYTSVDSESSEKTFSWANTTFSEFSSLSKDFKKKKLAPIYSKLPADPTIPISSVQDEVRKFSDKHVLAKLTDKDDKMSKKVRHICGIGVMEAVTLFKGTGCRNLYEFQNYTIDKLTYESLNQLMHELHSNIISWERTSKFAAVILELYQIEGLNLNEKVRTSNYLIN